MPRKPRRTNLVHEEERILVENTSADGLFYIAVMLLSTQAGSLADLTISEYISSGTGPGQRLWMMNNLFTLFDLDAVLTSTFTNDH